MPRTPNALNIEAFQTRKMIPTSSNKDVLHLADVSGSPIERFLSLLRHQDNFLNWIDKRHTMLQEARRDHGRRSPKNKTFLKYNWYSKQLVLLESINAFEKFYKTTLVDLCAAIRPYVKTSEMKPFEIDAEHLFGDLPNSDLVTAYFEGKTYHNPVTIDFVSGMLIGKKRYESSQLKSEKKTEIEQSKRCVQAIFQIRHTLSHNNGYVTVGDRIKLKRYGIQIDSQRVIDPEKNNIQDSICRFMIDEALSYTRWLLDETTSFLETRLSDLGCDLEPDDRKKLEALFHSKTGSIRFEFPKGV